jgi:hypothetical protein
VTIRIHVRAPHSVSFVDGRGPFFQMHANVALSPDEVGQLRDAFLHDCRDAGVPYSEATDAFNQGLLALMSLQQPDRSPSSPQAAPARPVLAPGVRLARVLRVLLTRRAFRTRVQVAIAEMQAEYIEELAQGHIWQARWVAVRGHCLVVWPFFCALVPTFVRRMFSSGHFR